MPRVGITAYDLLISCPGDVNQFYNKNVADIDKRNYRDSKIIHSGE